MPDWLQAVLNTLVPVLILIVVVVLARIAYSRLTLRPATPTRVTHSQPGERLDTLENLVRRYYKAQGYEVLHNGGEFGLVAVKEDQRTVVRCLEGETPLDEEAVEAAALLRKQHDAQRIVLVAPQGFSEAALQRAATLNVELRGQDHIAVMLNLMRRRETA
jgi:hypothetical protein